MTNLKFVSMIATCTIIVAFISVIFQAYLESQKLAKLTTIITGLVHLTNPYRPPPLHQQQQQSKTNNEPIIPRIAIGYGSCSDLYVSATTFLNYSINFEESENKEFLNGDITNEEELLESFGYYFSAGAAAERYISNQTLFRNLIELTKSFPRRWALGGNAPVMATRFIKQGGVVLLAAEMSNKLREHVPNEIIVAGGEPIEYDDIHLILEYKTGDTWGPFTSPRANRYILHNDHSNPMINSLEYFENQLNHFNSNLLVISGLQMMDSLSIDQSVVREQRLLKVREQMAKRSLKVLIHFEMASYVELALVNLLFKHVIPFSNSIGLNEQELDNVYQILSTGNISFSSESNPRVAITLDKMRYVFHKLYYNYRKNTVKDLRRRQLTRIHVHTLAYQAILIERGSEWLNIKAATAKASLIAHQHVCQSKIINPDSASLILDDSFVTTAESNSNGGEIQQRRIYLNASDPVSCWQERLISPFLNDAGNIINVDICVAPVLVCKIARQTAGAGDNISAASLGVQIGLAN